MQNKILLSKQIENIKNFGQIEIIRAFLSNSSKIQNFASI